MSYPAGEATAADELIAVYNEHHLFQGADSLEARRVTPGGRIPRYSGDSKSNHVSEFSRYICTALLADGTVIITSQGDPASVTEGRPAAFRLTRAPPTTTAMTVKVAVTQIGEVIKTADSYQPPTEVRFTRGQATAILTVLTDDDDQEEEDGSVIATLQDGAGYRLGAASMQTAEITVKDNEAPRPPPPPIVVQPPPTPQPPGTPSTGGGGGGGSGGGGGGGGGGRARPPSYPGTVRAEGGDGEVTLTWDAPASRGSSRIQHYEYRIDGEGEWISTGSTGRIHTIAGLVNGRVYFFHLRAVSAAGAGAHRISPESMPVADLDFTHFANGGFVTSTLALVNAGAYPVRPAIYFYDQDGDPIAARRVVDLTPDLEVGDDGALRPRAVMNPLGELTIATHGRGGLRAGSVTVRAPGSIGGVLRFDIPGFGVAGVGDSPTLRDALVPVRHQDGGINTGVAVRNRGTAALTLQCRLMRDGAVLEETDIRLAANGQDSRFIDQVFPTADTSDFAGSVRCTAPEPGRFSAVAFELDGVHRIFTTLPVVPVVEVP